MRGAAHALRRASQASRVEAREGGTLTMLQHDAQGDGAEEDRVLEVGGEQDVGLVMLLIIRASNWYQEPVIGTNVGLVILLVTRASNWYQEPVIGAKEH